MISGGQTFYHNCERSSTILKKIYGDSMDLSGDSDGKESACNARDLGSIPRSGNPWRREWQPTPIFLPGEFHGQRSLAGYSAWGCQELDTTEQLILSLFFFMIIL